MKDKKTGTKEWSDVSVNLQYGCRNNCRYCVSPETRILLPDHSEKAIKWKDSFRKYLKRLEASK